MKQQLPKPPRYYLGFLQLKSGQEVRFPDAIMYPLSEQAMRVVIRDPLTPLDGEILIKGKILEQPITHIQYAISMLDKGEEYRIELFNHPFESDTTFFRYNKSAGGHIIECEDGDLLKTYDCEEVMKCKSPYPVIQFIS
jgi:hypothetical protein